MRIFCDSPSIKLAIVSLTETVGWLSNNKWLDEYTMQACINDETIIHRPDVATCIHSCHSLCFTY